MVQAEIYRGNYGDTYSFWYRDLDYSGHTAKITVWYGFNTIIVDGLCDVTVVGNDSRVDFLTVPGAFDVAARNYEAKIVFFNAGSSITEPTFNWKVFE